MAILYWAELFEHVGHRVTRSMKLEELTTLKPILWIDDWSTYCSGISIFESANIELYQIVYPLEYIL